MRRVAILGGGLAGLSTALELTRSGQPLEITVYQLGWRLGGKGASGRNALHGQRIEEHGLHAFSGLYDNAFAAMREAYEGLARPAGHPLATWREAFQPCRSIVLHEQHGGRTLPWTLRLPNNAQLPGEPDAQPALAPLTYAEILLDSLRLLQGLEPPDRLAGPTRRPSALGRALVRAARRFFQSPLVARPLLALARQLLLALWSRVRVRLDDDTLRRAWIGANFAYGNLRGYVAEDVAHRGFSALDDQDYRAWLSKYLLPDTVDGRSLTLASPLAGFLYDAQFAYTDGDISKPSFAAGTALQTLLRMAFTWKGAVIWKMQAGMGDVVFAPLYALLRQRGVRFEFFHELRGLHLDGDRLSAVELSRQVRTRGEYQPLVLVKGLPCWPSQPLWEQIEGGEALAAQGVNLERYDGPCCETRTLTLGQDLDEVVLAVSLGALPRVAAQLIARSPRWKQLVEGLSTVQTQAAQVWFRGAPDPLPQGRIGVNLAPQRLNTWASMDHLLPAEDLPPDVGGLLYLCGVHSPESAAADPLADTQALLTQDLHKMAPWAGQPAAIYTAELPNPSDRFVQSPAGGNRLRLAPQESGFAQLTLAGDWTRTGFNLGNAECATLSGRIAARAICGHHPHLPGAEGA